MSKIKRVIYVLVFYSFAFIYLNTSFGATGTVNTTAARIREKASTDSEIITNVYEGDEIEILEEDGDWYKVKVNGKTGYVSKSLIKTSQKKDSDKTTNTSSNNTLTNDSDSNSTNNTNTVSTTADSKENNNSDNNVSTYNNSSVENKDNNESKNIINSDTSLKLLPSFISNELKVLTKDTEVKVEKELNNWVKISLLDNTTGWVLKTKITYDSKEINNEQPVEETTNTIEDSEKNNNENLVDKNTVSNETKTEEKKNTGKINVETANVRKNADKTSEIVGKLDQGAEVTIVEETGDWYKITSSKIKTGYISKSLVSTSSSDVSSRSLLEVREANNGNEIDNNTNSNDNQTEEKAEVSVNNSTNGGSVVEFAKQYLGKPYVSGGKTPETGFDCSGFTRYVYGNFGYSLAGVAASQESAGTSVDRENLQPGDLILFYDEAKTKIGHVGIYIGNNEFIHAANPQRGVVTDNLSTNSYYNERYISSRRIVE